MYLAHLLHQELHYLSTPYMQQESIISSYTVLLLMELVLSIYLSHFLMLNLLITVWCHDLFELLGVHSLCS